MNVVILAAGMGKRMNSRLPKVLQPIAGRSMLSRVVDVARRLPDARIIVVVGHGGDQVRQALGDSDLRDIPGEVPGAVLPGAVLSGAVHYAVQEPQLGTGHAVQQAVPLLDDHRRTLVLYGDVPLTRLETLQDLSGLVAEGSDGTLALLTLIVADPTGYGRVVRSVDGLRVEAIVEEKDATGAQRAIREINTGILLASTPHLKRWLGRLTNDNAQREYYLTDIVGLAHADGAAIVAMQPAFAWETTGVNDKAQLADLERRCQANEAAALLKAGVTLADPARIDVRGTLVCGRDVTIDVGCVFEGDVEIGDGVRIGPCNVIRHARIAAGARIDAFCHIDGGAAPAPPILVGERAVVGPYARLRPGTTLDADVHVGNFVEVKNSQLGVGSKANHLSYLGDATLGSQVNVGAGTITCNYDGANKHRTVIEDGVHIGSDVQLVAPVTIGAGATIGAGTTVWKDVPPGTLVVNPKTQVDRDDWQRPHKNRR